jgi:hypothetical protein
LSSRVSCLVRRGSEVKIRKGIGGENEARAR